jgi:hypothetical protein
MMSRTIVGTEELEKSPEELDLEIGRLLLADQFGSKPFSEAEAMAAARRWLAANIAKLRDGICSNTLVQNELLNQKARSRNELFAAVADALVRVPGLGGIPVVVLAARLIHYGMGQLCGELPKGPGP